MWDNFNDTITKEIVNESFSFGVIATEIPTNDSLNYIYDEENRNRTKNLIEVIKKSKFVWLMTDKAINYYEAFAPSFYIELGYTKFCEPKKYMKGIQPDFDIGFYGIPNQYRMNLMNQLPQKLKICWPMQHELHNSEELQFFIQRCKYGISLGQRPDWKYPSQSRLARFFSGSRQVICEPFFDNTFKYSLTKKVNISDFSNFVTNIDLKNWKKDGIDVFEIFSKQLKMRDQLINFLEAINISPVKSKEEFYYSKKIDLNINLDSYLESHSYDLLQKVSRVKKKGFINRLKRSIIKRFSD